ncbi:MAG: hypothetical protein PVG03_14780 [Desulfarculaceae bacterium]
MSVKAPLYFTTLKSAQNDTFLKLKPPGKHFFSPLSKASLTNCHRQTPPAEPLLGCRRHIGMEVNDLPKIISKIKITG